MAIKKPTPKPMPRPKQKIMPGPSKKQAPLDLVRNPNFDAAMAQQNYQNSMAGMKAKIDAEQAGILSKQGPQEGGGQRPSDRFDDYRGQLPPQGGGDPDFIQEDPNRKYAAVMVDYIDPATGERTSRTRGVVPGPGSRFVPANKAGMYVQRPPQEPGGGMGGLAPQQPGRLIQLPGGDMDELVKRDIYNDLMKRQRQLNPPSGTIPTDPNIGMPGLMPGLMPIETGGSMSIGTGDPRFIYNNLQPPFYQSEQGTIQIPSSEDKNAKNFGQIAQGISKLMPQIPQFPQGKQQQMQNYQNFLQQGMQNSNALNQGATGNFANMQPGMQSTQTASTAPRKFSITSNPQVKAF
jgi:hypothetical protein